MSASLVTQIIMGMVPASGVLLQTGVELPNKYKKIFFKFVPTWMSSSVIAILIGTLLGGVTGPMTGFMSELILFPGFAMIKKNMDLNEIKTILSNSKVDEDRVKKLLCKGDD